MALLLFLGSATSWSAPAPKSVYEIHPLLDGAILGSTLLTNAIATAQASRWIKPSCPCDPNEVNAFDRHVIGNNSSFTNTVSDVTVGLSVLAPIALDWKDQGSSHEFLEDALVYAETLSVSGALVTVAKYTAQRPLPVVYAGQAPELNDQPGGYRSFYSGHTTLAFSALSAASMTLNLRYHLGAWPWIVTGAIGTSVAIERVLAGRHFYTDVIVGALMGTGVGILVPYFHAREASSKESLRILPAEDGLKLSFTKRF